MYITINPIIETTLKGIGRRKITRQFYPCSSRYLSPFNVPSINNNDTDTKVKIFVAEPKPYSSKCEGTVSIIILGAEAIIKPVATPKKNLMIFNQVKFGHISAKLMIMNIILPNMTSFLLPIRAIIFPPKNEPRATPRIEYEEIEVSASAKYFFYASW